MCAPSIKESKPFLRTLLLLASSHLCTFVVAHKTAWSKLTRLGLLLFFILLQAMPRCIVGRDASVFCPIIELPKHLQAHESLGRSFLFLQKLMMWLHLAKESLQVFSPYRAPRASVRMRMPSKFFASFLKLMMLCNCTLFSQSNP